MYELSKISPHHGRVVKENTYDYNLANLEVSSAETHLEHNFVNAHENRDVESISPDTDPYFPKISLQTNPKTIRMAPNPSEDRVQIYDMDEEPEPVEGLLLESPEKNMTSDNNDDGDENNKQDNTFYTPPKFRIGHPGDKYEQEAEAVANRVVNMGTANTLQMQPVGEEEELLQPKLRMQPLEEEEETVRMKCAECEEEEMLQTKSDSGGGFVSPIVSQKIQMSKGKGRNLSGSTNQIMSSAFDTDFSGVQIHTGTESVLINHDLRAKAFTVGNDIYFNEGQYNFGSQSGIHLLAHELTHTIQQSNNTISGTSYSGVVQRFASEEHQRMGDIATGSTSYNFGTAKDKFELTHGDILALSGDVFMPDELFRLAAIPGNNGKKTGTRDEIIWALQDTRIWEMRAENTGSNPFAQQQDPRFQAGGVFAGFVFSDAVKAAVFEKYQKLGAANASHFVAPVGRDKAGAPIVSTESAGSKYVKFHQEAISTADKAGRAGLPPDMAMASDAAAQHYLTDVFSSGHIRTPIASIREYWGNKYPLFWYNLRHKIALDTAIEMTSGTVIPTNTGYTRILAAVEAMAPTLPAVTLGDLLGSIYHDVDNESGVDVKGGGKIFGDKNLDAATQKLAVDAIKASNNDIIKAYEHGKTTATPVTEKDLFDNVRTAGGGSSTKYAAELAIPEPDPKEPSQNWKATDINALWGQKFLGKKGDTVGDVISKRVQGGSIAIQLTALGDRFPADQDAYVAMLHPRASYLTGFVKKLQADPKAGVLDIINWAPHDMWTGDAEGDVIKDLKSKGDAGNKTENLGTMSHEQRVNFVKLFISDGKPGWILSGNPGAYDNLIAFFENINAKERKKVYKDIEGRLWNGTIKANDEFSFKIRVQDKGKDKDIMDKTRVAKFKKVMNGK